MAARWAGLSDSRNYGGDGQRFFLCSVCSRKVQHLYLRGEGERLACRRLGLENEFLDIFAM